MDNSISIRQEPLFDPNAFGIATLLGGLFVLGISADLMIDSESDPLAINLGYIGFALILISFISFLYSCVSWMTRNKEETTPLIVVKV